MLDNQGSRKMTHLPVIWNLVRAGLPRGKWVSLDDIYSVVSASVLLDREDQLPQSPTSAIPKWKRNVRNVLQYRKGTAKIQWDGNSRYKM